jgi:hypothetical protein
VQAWDRSYHYPDMDPATRAKIVSDGMESLERALKIKADSFDALTYMNLLYREKAKLELDPVKQQEWIAKAEEWTKKAIAVRDAQKAREAAQKKT